MFYSSSRRTPYLVPVPPAPSSPTTLVNQSQRASVKATGSLLHTTTRYPLTATRYLCVRVLRKAPHPTHTKTLSSPSSSFFLLSPLSPHLTSLTSPSSCLFDLGTSAPSGHCAGPLVNQRVLPLTAAQQCHRSFDLQIASRAPIVRDFVLKSSWAFPFQSEKRRKRFIKKSSPPPPPPKNTPSTKVPTTPFKRLQIAHRL